MRRRSAGAAEHRAADRADLRPGVNGGPAVIAPRGWTCCGSPARRRSCRDDKNVSRRSAFKFCVDESGPVTTITVLQASGDDRYDAKIVAAMHQWAYRPVIVDGRRTAVCSAITFIYNADEVASRQLDRGGGGSRWERACGRRGRLGQGARDRERRRHRRSSRAESRSRARDVAACRGRRGAGAAREGTGEAARRGRRDGRRARGREAAARARGRRCDRGGGRAADRRCVDRHDGGADRGDPAGLGCRAARGRQGRRQAAGDRDRRRRDREAGDRLDRGRYQSGDDLGARERIYRRGRRTRRT